MTKRIILGAAAALLICTGVSSSVDTRSASAERATPVDISDAECRVAMDMIFSGHADRATAYIDSLESIYPDSPLYRLTRARVYREYLPIDDENKDEVRRIAEPIHADIDRAIDECTRRIDAGDDDPRLLLYRGWGWMFKSHIRTFERSFWSAGRDAKKGKGDLIEYMRRDPEDPIATGIMGSFLYFADTLPSAYKFISKLLFMPSGDREEGLRLMAMSCSQPSLIEMDNKTLLYSVYMAFEGRYEDALAGFARMHRRYPHYSAFVRPYAILLPFSPRQHDASMKVIDRVLAERSNGSFESRTPSFALLRYSRAYANRFYDPAQSVAEYEAIVADAPEHPDWLVGYAQFDLARMAAARGDAEGARKLLAAVLGDKSSEYLYGDARRLLEEVDRAPAPTAVTLDVAAIYTGDDGRVRALADDLAAVDPPTAQSDFYLGDALLRLGDTEGALAAFRRAVERDAPEWDEAYQMIACSRLAETMGAAFEFERAANHLDTATRFYHKEFLYDWFYDGRKRFYSRLANGEDHSLPTLFSTVH